MDLVRRQGSKVSKRSAGSREMVSYFLINVKRVQYCRKEWQAMSGKVAFLAYKSINTSQWTTQQENKMFKIQDQVGNKWALISSKLPGRTDNCVKNHFYSKLRKGLRKLNKKIQRHFKREYKQIKTATLYKIIETIENKGKNNLNGEIETFQLSKKIKNEIKELEDEVQKINYQNQEFEYIRNILEDIAMFQPQIKKVVKKNALKSSNKLEDENFSLKPLSNKISSTKSVYDDQQSQFSNSQLYSSSSFGQKSFHSNKSQGLLKNLKVKYRSHSIPSQSQSEDQQHFLNGNILYKSANLLSTQKNNFKHKSQANLFDNPKLLQGSFRQVSQPIKDNQQKKSISSEKSENSLSFQRFKIFQCGANHINMIGEQQNVPIYMKMRFFSPKKPSHEDIMEMYGQRDKLFYGQKIEIDCENLIRNFQGLGLRDLSKFGQALDI